ncbi:hypothetical protein JCM3766R1_000727 [Sporobolomyces carnicolor]
MIELPQLSPSTFFSNLGRGLALLPGHPSDPSRFDPSVASSETVPGAQELLMEHQAHHEQPPREDPNAAKPESLSERAKVSTYDKEEDNQILQLITRDHNSRASSLKSLKAYQRSRAVRGPERRITAFEKRPRPRAASKDDAADSAVLDTEGLRRITPSEHKALCKYYKDVESGVRNYFFQGKNFSLRDLDTIETWSKRDSTAITSFADHPARLSLKSYVGARFISGAKEGMRARGLLQWAEIDETPVGENRGYAVLPSTSQTTTLAPTLKLMEKRIDSQFRLGVNGDGVEPYGESIIVHCRHGHIDLIDTIKPHQAEISGADAQNGWRLLSAAERTTLGNFAQSLIEPAEIDSDDRGHGVGVEDPGDSSKEGEIPNCKRTAEEMELDRQLIAVKEYARSHFCMLVERRSRHKREYERYKELCQPRPPPPCSASLVPNGLESASASTIEPGAERDDEVWSPFIASLLVRGAPREVVEISVSAPSSTTHHLQDGFRRVCESEWKALRSYFWLLERVARQTESKGLESKGLDLTLSELIARAADQRGDRLDRLGEGLKECDTETITASRNDFLSLKDFVTPQFNRIIAKLIVSRNPSNDRDRGTARKTDTCTLKEQVMATQGEAEDAQRSGGVDAGDRATDHHEPTFPQIPIVVSTSARIDPVSAQSETARSPDLPLEISGTSLASASRGTIQPSNSFLEEDSLDKLPMAPDFAPPAHMETDENAIDPVEATGNKSIAAVDFTSMLRYCEPVAALEPSRSPVLSEGGPETTPGQPLGAVAHEGYWEAATMANRINDLLLASVGSICSGVEQDLLGAVDAAENEASRVDPGAPIEGPTGAMLDPQPATALAGPSPTTLHQTGKLNELVGTPLENTRSAESGDKELDDRPSPAIPAQRTDSSIPVSSEQLETQADAEICDDGSAQADADMRDGSVSQHLVTESTDSIETKPIKRLDETKPQETPASSDLSDCDRREAPSQDDDSGNESLTEVVAKRRAQRPSDPRPSKRKPATKRDFPGYLEELISDEGKTHFYAYVPWWADPSVSDGVREFVDERNTIFALQRRFRSPKREAGAIDIATLGRAAVSMREHRNYLEQLATYIAFCRILRLNPFPISNALIALFMYQFRAQWPEETRQRTAESLRTLATWTSPLYDVLHPTLVKLNAWPRSEEVIKELRKPIRHSKRDRSSSTAVQADRAKDNSLLAHSASGPSAPSIAASSAHHPKNARTVTAASPATTRAPPCPSRPNSGPLQTVGRGQKRSRSKIDDAEEASPRQAAQPVPSQPHQTKVSGDRDVPMPKPGDRFRTARAAFMSIAAAEIYSNGACQDEDQWTVKTISPHDHGPAPELLCDSDWKPKTQNLDILEAIRQDEQDSGRSESSEPPSKRVRIASPPSACGTPAIEASTTEVIENRPAEPNRARVQPPPPSSDPDHEGSRRESPVAEESKPSFPSSPFRMPQPQPPAIKPISLRSRAFLKTTPVQPVEHSAIHDTHEDPFYSKPTPAIKPLSHQLRAFIKTAPVHAVEHSASHDTLEDPFYSKPTRPLDLTLSPVPQVAHFLSSLDPSLSSITRSLCAAGYSTLNSLIEFASLSPRVRQIVYKQILKRAPNESGVSQKQFDLLEQRLVDASLRGWP